MRKMERVYHTWDKWESFYNGFFDNTPPKGMSKKDAEQLYYQLLSDPAEFSHALQCVIEEWPYSCEHNLTNKTLNRIAWMGQAALSYKHKIPAQFRGGYNLLTKQQQSTADDVALKYINIWLAKQGYPSVEYDTANAVDVKQPLY